MILLGIAGTKYAGKDTFAKAMQRHGFKDRKFATPLKNMIRTLLVSGGIPLEEINEYVEGSKKEVPLDCLCGKTTRHAMQTLGTEWRELIGRDLWIEMMRKQLQASSVESAFTISDVRFHHEVKMIHDLGGKVLLIYRGGFSSDPHPSEIDIPHLRHDFSFCNTGTLGDLQLEADRIAAAF